jgi:hypothetical protein
MRCRSEDECSSFTGNYYAKNYKFRAAVQPLSGVQHMMILRAEGICRHYKAGFDGQNKVSLVLTDFGMKRLIEVPYKWTAGVEYWFEASCEGDMIEFFINGKRIFQVEDDRFKRGMFGFSVLGKGEALLSDIEVKEL